MRGLPAVTPLVTLAAALALAGCAAHDPAAAPSPAVASTPGTDAVPAGVQVATGEEGAVGVADVAGAAWTVLPEAGEVVAGADRRIAVGAAPLRLVDTPSGVWVSVIRDGTVVRIAPDTDEVDLRVSLRPEGSEPEGLAYDGSSVWVVDQAHDRVLPLDPDTGVLGTPVRVGEEPRLVAAGRSGIWVANYRAGSLSLVHPGRPRARTVELDSCPGAQGVAEAAGVVWVSCTVADRVVGVDVRTLRAVAGFDGLAGADALVAAGDLVYAVGQQGPTVWTIDATTRTVVARLVLDAAPTTRENVGAAVVGEDLVVTHPDVRRTYTVPLTMLAPR